MTGTLDIRRPSAHVAEVYLNRPEVRNAFNDGVIAELTQAFAVATHTRQRRILNKDKRIDRLHSRSYGRDLVSRQWM